MSGKFIERGSFIPPEPGSDEWTVATPVIYTDGGVTYTVESGFKFDLASIPWYCQWLIEEDEGVGASALHDKAYSGGYRWLNRRAADMLFHNALIAWGVKKWKAFIMYKAVRRLGWAHWG